MNSDVRPVDCWFISPSVCQRDGKIYFHVAIVKPRSPHSMAMRSLAAGVIGPSRYVSIRGDFSEDVKKEV